MQTSAYILLMLAIGATAAPVDDPQLLSQPQQANYLPPDSNYLPPEVADAVAETTVIPEVIVAEPLIVTKNLEAVTVQEVPQEVPVETAELNDDGYAYKTVRQIRLRFRTRRDVSHLNLAYLPPAQDYLPPLEAAATEQPEAATPKINLDYLPPVEQQALKLPEEVEVEEEEEETVESVATEATAAETEAPQDTAVLAADGYHYKQPEVAADLSSAAIATPVTREYLPPPVEADVVMPELEEPASSSAELTDAGYHYRAFNRFRY